MRLQYEASCNGYRTPVDLAGTCPSRHVEACSDSTSGAEEERSGAGGGGGGGGRSGRGCCGEGSAGERGSTQGRPKGPNKSSSSSVFIFNLKDIDGLYRGSIPQIGSGPNCFQALGSSPGLLQSPIL